jgi:hypothetical protein
MKNKLEDQLTGAQMIATERQRQQTEEGYTAEMDDQCPGFKLVRGAYAYLQHYLFGIGIDSWPWGLRTWKPDTSDNRLRDLVKSGALIAAEIDRLQRKAKNEHPKPC